MKRDYGQLSVLYPINKLGKSRNPEEKDYNATFHRGINI